MVQLWLLLPNLSIKLSSLRAVLNKKAEELPRLLELQGRLKLMDDSAALRNEFSAEEIAEDLEERSDIEYNEEIDDAKYVGVISDDEAWMMWMTLMILTIKRKRKRKKRKMVFLMLQI